MALHGQFQAIYNILLVIAVISLATRRFKLPSSLSFILAGVMSTALTSFPLPHLSPEIFTSLLLPPILFQETLHLDIRGMVEDSKPILGFAVVGTLLTLAAVGVFLNVFMGFSVLEALLLGVIIAPTDPVAVINVFQEIGVVKRFQLIVCGESLLNDGVAIALYSIIVTVVTLGTITLTGIARITAVAILGGVLLGVLFSYAAHTLFCWTDDKFTVVLISFLTAFGVFWISETIGASGVIAIVTTGLIINYRTHAFGGIGQSSFEMLEAMWEFVGFAASSIAFIFIGANLDIAVLYSNMAPVLYLFGFLMISRYLMVYILRHLIETMGGRSIPTNWMFGLSWSGLRGAVSVVLALGVYSLALPHSEVIVAMTFGVVLTSNVIQGLTISEVVKRTNLSTKDEAEHESEDPQRWMNDSYSSKGFRNDVNRMEKILFSAPEYFVFETRLGTWIMLRLHHILEFINTYTATRIPKAQGGLLRRAFEASTDVISSLLTRMTRARRNYYWERERGTRSFSRYQIRKRQVGRFMQRVDEEAETRGNEGEDKPSDAG